MHAPGIISIKGTQHSFSGPTRDSYPLSDLPQADPAPFSQKLLFRSIDDGKSASDVTYDIFTIPDGATTWQRDLAGISSSDGSERKLNPMESESMVVLYGQGEWGTMFDADIDRDAESVSGSIDDEGNRAE